MQCNPIRISLFGSAERSLKRIKKRESKEREEYDQAIKELITQVSDNSLLLSHKPVQQISSKSEVIENLPCVVLDEGSDYSKRKNTYSV